MTDLPSEIPIPPELTKLGIQELINLFKKSPAKLGKFIQKRVKQLVKSRKYLISISEEVTTELYKITKQDLYKRLEDCLFSHWSLNLIALGVYISKLNESDQRELVEQVRGEVHSKYRAEGIRILDIGSTGAINYLIGYISDLKMKKDYNFNEMGDIFDKIISRWKEITLFVKSEDDVKLVKTRCLHLLNKKEPLFFIFAYGSAIYPCINAIAELNNERKLAGYIWDAKTRSEGLKEVYSCTFESVEGYGIDTFA